LTHLCMASPNFAQGIDTIAALTILRSCPHLKYCRLNVVDSIATPDFDSRLVTTMPFLESLHLRSNDVGWSFASLLQHLELPKLYDFGIESGYIPGGWDQGSVLPVPPRNNSQWSYKVLTGFLARAVTPLKRLLLQNIHLNADNLKECLQLTPELVEFSFRDSPVVQSEPSLVPEMLLKLLTPDSPSSATSSSVSVAEPILSPALESITLRSYYAPTDAAIFNFVQSRWKPQLPGLAQLKSAAFQFEMDNPTEELKAGIIHNLPVPGEPQLDAEAGVGESSKDREPEGNRGEESEPSHIWDDLKDMKKQGLKITVLCAVFDVLNGCVDVPLLVRETLI
jgi:hypothetical protein